MQVKAVLLIRRKRMTSSFSPTAGKSREEEDLLQRSKKKVRSWEVGENGSSLDDADGTPSFKQVVGDSYKEKLLNIFGEEVPEKQDFKNLEPPPLLQPVETVRGQVWSYLFWTRNGNSGPSHGSGLSSQRFLVRLLVSGLLKASCKDVGFGLAP